MRRIALLMLMTFAVAGCNRGEGQTLEQFSQQWEKTLNTQAYDQLYGMLGLASQRHIRRDLEVMRGLDIVTHRMVLDQLESDDIKDLRKLMPSRYFSLLWHRATGNQQGKIAVAGRGLDSADMVVTFNGDKRMSVRLTRENNRWVWQLPPQNLRAPNKMGVRRSAAKKNKSPAP